MTAKRKKDTEEKMPASSFTSSVPTASPLFTHQFGLVSMNVAMCRPSAVAPPSWTPTDQMKHLVSCLLFQENASSSSSSSAWPLVVALQECPSPEWSDAVFGPYGYQTVASARTHMGWTCLIVLQQQESTVPRISVCHIQPIALPEPSSTATRLSSSPFPAAVATMTLELPTDPTTVSAAAAASNESMSPPSPPQRRLTCLLASVHLEPFAEGSVIRQKQLQALHNLAVSQPDSTLMIIAGDTNMREQESDFVERNLHFLDAWKAAGAARDTKFTWDTIDHRHGRAVTSGSNRRRSGGKGPSTANTGAWFNAYYGYEGTRQYNARYDRIYLYHKDNVASRTASASSNQRPWKVQNFSLVAHRPIPPSNDHFLSDHFGISVTLNLSMLKGN